MAASVFQASLSPGSPVAAVPTDGKPPSPAIRKAAQAFEAFFLSRSLTSMFAGVDTNSLFGGGPAESVYRSLLLQQYGKIAARSGGLGIADAVQRELLHSQEAK